MRKQNAGPPTGKENLDEMNGALAAFVSSNVWRKLHMDLASTRIPNLHWHTQVVGQLLNNFCGRIAVTRYLFTLQQGGFVDIPRNSPRNSHETPDRRTSNGIWFVSFPSPNFGMVRPHGIGIIQQAPRQLSCLSDCARGSSAHGKGTITWPKAPREPIRMSTYSK
jgi:hypothetical protein